MNHVKNVLLLICASCAILLALSFFSRRKPIEAQMPLVTKQMVAENQEKEQKEQTQRSNAAAARRHAELMTKMTACNTNEECIIVDRDPCGCLKGPQGVTAINASYSLEFSKMMEKRFALATACPSVGSTEKECSASARPICLQNRCKIGYQE